MRAEPSAGPDRPTRVGVLGAHGRMGTLICGALEEAPDLTLVAALGRGEEREPLRAAQVVVDVTRPEAVLGNVAWCLAAGLCIVVGTSGVGPRQLDELTRLLATCPVPAEQSVLVVPNFALGAVLAERMAAQAAPYFASVELVETHHAGKVDAPSGTARRTAERLAAVRSAAGLGPPPEATQPEVSLPGARGAAVAGIPVHALRLSGAVAHQEVYFSGPGEVLTISHDVLDRRSYLPGVLLAVRAARGRPGLTVGLEALLEAPL